MAEMDLTKKITGLIKAGDKLVRDVAKDVKLLKDSATSLRDSFKKPEDKAKD